MMSATDHSDHAADDDGHPQQQANATLSPAQQRRKLRGQKLKAGFTQFGNALQKINLGKLIDDMEHDQEIADELEAVNQELNEESQRKELVREATAACHAEIENHLDEFLIQHPSASYEDWITDLHPDNVMDGRLFEDIKEVDLRFYVVDSDHRILWNSKHEDAEEKQVPARTYLVKEGQGQGQESPSDGGAPAIDLLS